MGCFFFLNPGFSVFDDEAGKEIVPIREFSMNLAEMYFLLSSAVVLLFSFTSISTENHIYFELAEQVKL